MNLYIDIDDYTFSPNKSALESNYAEPEMVESSLSYRDLYCLHKINMIRKELNGSLAESNSEENFTMPSDKTFNEASALITQISMFEEPLVSIITDGSIVFEWANDNAILSASLNGEETLIFAGVFNRTGRKKKLSGTIPMSNNILPKEFVEILKKHFVDDKFQCEIEFKIPRQ